MKKLLLLLAGLLFAVLPSVAQQKIADITDRVVTKAADLTSGYYILNCYYLKQSGDADTKPNGSVVYKTVENQRNIQSDAAGFINEEKTQLNNNQASYIWFVKKADDGTYTIRNAETNIYFPLDSEKGKNMSNPASKKAAVYTLKDKKGTDILNRTYSGIVLQTTADNGESWSVFANYGGSGNPTLSYWTAGGGGEVLFQFVEVKNIDFDFIYPFHTSAAPSNGTFSEKTKWQLLTINNKYLYYTDDNTEIKAAENYSTDASYLWAFHMNEDGKIVIYNKAAGAEKVLAAGAMTGNNGDGTFPKFVSATDIPKDQIAVWDGHKSYNIIGKDGFYLFRGENQNEKMQLHTVNGTDVLSFSTTEANASSTFWVLPYVNYTIKYVNERGETLETPASTTGTAIAGTDIPLTRLEDQVLLSVVDNNGNKLTVDENNSIVLPESYDCVITVTYGDYPFKTSDAPTAEGFSPNTYWYYMTLSGAYVTHVEGQKYCPAAATTNPIEYGSFWAFVKNEAGQIEIYNAATGPTYVLASSSPLNDDASGGNTHPFMKEKNSLPDTEKGVWNIKHTGSDNFFFLNIPGEGEENSYINSRESKLAFWVDGSSNTNDGSKLRVQEVDIKNLIATTRVNQGPYTGIVGTLNKDSYANFTAALDKGTAEGLSEALKIRDLTGQKVELDHTKYYRLKNVKRYGFLGLNANNQYLRCATSLDKNNASLLWKINKNEDNTVELFHANAQQNVEAIQQKGVNLSIGLTENKAKYNLKKWNATQFGFYINSNYLVQSNNNGEMGSWNEPAVNSDHAWYLILAEDIELNISAAGYATVNYPFAVQLPEGLTAYTGTANAEKSKFMLEEVSGGAVPANTPVVIEGAKGTYPLTIDYTNQTPSIKKDLSGSLLPINIDTDDYVLGTYNNVVGFYKTNGGELAQNKAYIESTPVIQAIRGFGFSTEGDGTTGIENTVTETENEEYYDLQGRRVLNPTKGIYVTKSGKKVLFTK